MSTPGVLILRVKKQADSFYLVRCPSGRLGGLPKRAPELVTATRRARGVSPSNEYAWRAYPESKKTSRQFLSGEVSEWSKEHAWKVCIRKRIEGSNPSLTAKYKKPGF